MAGRIGTDSGLRYDNPGPTPTASVEHAGPRLGPAGNAWPQGSGNYEAPATAPPVPKTNRIHHK
jgi:hypothetical protein